MNHPHNQHIQALRRNDNGNSCISSTDTGANTNTNTNSVPHVIVGKRDMGMHHANSIDIIQGILFMVLAASMVGFVASGRYITYVTPRTVPYIIAAAIILALFGVASCFAMFHCSMQSLSKSIIVLVIPILLLVIPVESNTQSSAGLSRAIAIHDSSSTSLTGLDTAKKTITISDDQFGAWYDRIDRNASSYVGYTIILNGFISRDSSVSSKQFIASRMLMTCCVLDMTSFGFVVNAGSTNIASDGSWVGVTGKLARGSIGPKSHSYQGLVLNNATITASTSSASGYFYHQ